ncbi:Biotin Carboxyl Carrier Protein [Klebsormidium nitens]|uniref:Biotin carboxyl carrier protein of acetyl-CoA carboxylase n=1 Tax=Klebsormidium nitens TaxID=105231 RepID=A0A1Y1I5N9_KLENI|nr:Biotin Carboxyl Carrier Protein [Klebsormidium nitens]|eukprot:GAQ84037.1 Biotin Carboxyl Carrier Protein [Klebsormidium nitens]
MATAVVSSATAVPLGGLHIECGNGGERPWGRQSVFSGHAGSNLKGPLRSSFNGSRLDTAAQQNLGLRSATKGQTITAETQNDVATKEEAEPVLQEPSDEEETSAFIESVTSLIKLVDSRDIVELELKHKDIEIVIRKKEALTPAAAPAPAQQPQPQFFNYGPPPQQQQSAPPAAPAPAAAPAAAPAPTPAPAASGHTLASPMAGTFYRCPAPGEPPFVKEGDRVVKGQPICIVEAMKLMNEIEADKSGTVKQILAEDTKPVAAGTPLFIIEP